MARRRVTKRSVATMPATTPSEQRFVRGVLVRGEAALRDAEGKIPDSATHEIVGTSKTGLPELRRERFKLV